MNGKTRLLVVFAFVFLLAIYIPNTIAQECDTAAEMSPAVRSAIESAAQQYFSMTARGDVFGLRAAAIPSLASNFAGIEKAVIDNKDNYAGAQPSVRGAYLLVAEGAAARSQFFCGIFNSPDRVGFVINNLPAGRYAVVIMDSKGGKIPATLSLVLQDMQGQWKLAGFYPKVAQIGGHDGSWYLAKAREYKSKGQAHVAWFYYLKAWDLLAPVPFIGTAQLDKVVDEMQAARPPDLPSDKNPLSLAVSGKTVNVFDMAAVPVGNDLYFLVRYQTPSIANTAQVFQDNAAVMKAVLTKYPEFREAFGGIVARAVEPSGSDYGSLLAMKDVK
jgi:hypothetical protein